jgi:hypothetical protein
MEGGHSSSSFQHEQSTDNRQKDGHLSELAGGADDAGWYSLCCITARQEDPKGKSFLSLQQLIWCERVFRVPDLEKRVTRSMIIEPDLVEKINTENPIMTSN